MHFKVPSALATWIYSNAKKKLMKNYNLKFVFLFEFPLVIAPKQPFSKGGYFFYWIWIQPLNLGKNPQNFVAIFWGLHAGA